MDLLLWWIAHFDFPVLDDIHHGRLKPHEFKQASVQIYMQVI